MIDINSPKFLDNPPLAEAAAVRDIELFNFLLKQPNIDVNAYSLRQWGRGPLTYAIRAHRHEKPVEGVTPKYEMLEKLLARPELKVRGVDIEAAYDMRDPAILDLVLKKPIENPQEIDLGSLVAMDRYSNVRLAKILKIPGIDINRNGKVSGWDRETTALIVAIQMYRHAYRDLQRDLRDGEKPEDPENRENLVKEVEYHRERIEMLLAIPGINVNQTSEKSNIWSPLIAALKTEDPWMVERLLKVPGINVALETTDGFSALSYVRSGRRIDEKIKQLIYDALGIKEDDPKPEERMSTGREN